MEEEKSDHSGATGCITELTTETQYEEFLRNNKKVIIKFSAQWCGPCRRMVDYYSTASSVYKTIAFAKVDVTEKEDMANSHGIEFYPTFLCFKGGEEVDKVFGANFEKLNDAIKNLSDM